MSFSLNYIFWTIMTRVTVSLDFSRKDSIRTVRTIRSYEFARGEGLEWPADRFIHLSWLTRPISLPLSFFHAVLSAGTSSIRVKIRTANQFARLEFFDPAPRLRFSSPRVYGLHELPHTRSLFLPYGPYETMIKRARARRRVGRRIESLRCLEVVDSMMVTFRRERRCFSRPAYLKRDPTGPPYY